MLKISITRLPQKPRLVPIGTDRDPVSHEDIGVHDGDQLVEEVRLELKQLRRQLLHHFLQSFSSHRRNPVPGFRFTPGGHGQFHNGEVCFTSPVTQQHDIRLCGEASGTSAGS